MEVTAIVLTRWAWKWPRSWKTTSTATSSICWAPSGRLAAKTCRTSWFCRGWRCQSTWHFIHLPSTGSCSASLTEPQRWTFSPIFPYISHVKRCEICQFMCQSQKCIFWFLFQSLLTEMMERCKTLGNKWVFFEIPEGIWVQYLCSVTHYTYKTILTPSVWMVPTVLCCWIQSWGHSDLSLLRPVPPISSLWSKTVTRLASPRSEVTN